MKINENELYYANAVADPNCSADFNDGRAAVKELLAFILALNQEVEQLKQQVAVLEELAHPK